MRIKGVISTRDGDKFQSQNLYLFVQSGFFSPFSQYSHESPTPPHEPCMGFRLKMTPIDIIVSAIATRPVVNKKTGNIFPPIEISFEDSG